MHPTHSTPCRRKTFSPDPNVGAIFLVSQRMSAGRLRLKLSSLKFSSSHGARCLRQSGLQQASCGLYQADRAPVSSSQQHPAMMQVLFFNKAQTEPVVRDGTGASVTNCACKLLQSIAHPFKGDGFGQVGIHALAKGSTLGLLQCVGRQRNDRRVSKR